jgi:hypothetical protein
VSRRLGIFGGVSAIDTIPDLARDRLVEAIEAGQSLKHVRVIHDVLGMREPIIATTTDAAYKWHGMSVYAYDEKRVAAWEAFMEEMLSLSTGG